MKTRINFITTEGFFHDKKILLDESTIVTLQVCRRIILIEK